MLTYILWAALGVSFALNVGLIKVGKDLKKRVLAAEKNVRNTSTGNH
jgi:hypothetical protein